MGECGCYLRSKLVGKMPGPNRAWYFLSVYPGCRECDAPVGVSIDLLNRDEWRDQDIKPEDVPTIADSTRRNSGVPVVDGGLLADAMIRAIESLGLWKPEDDIDRDTWVEELDRMDIVVDSVSKTLKKELVPGGQG